jgi:CHAT domain-containing protein/Flp pilus assembly protein TadD
MAFMPLTSNAQWWKNHYNLMISLYNKGDYDNAIVQGTIALADAQKALQKNDTNYILILSNLSAIYYESYKYTEAETLAIELLPIVEKKYGEQHPKFLETLNVLALIYKGKHQFINAEALLLKILQITKNALGEEELRYFVTLNNLASLYRENGDYLKAEPLYLQSVAACKKKYGEEHPYYLESLNGLAVLYSNVGDYSKSETILIQMVESMKTLSMEEDIEYAIAFQNLAELYRLTGEYAKAESICLWAISKIKRKIGKENPLFATAINNLAKLYQSNGKFADAEHFFAEALSIRKLVLGETHLDYLESLNDLAVFYEIVGSFKKAEPLLQECLAIAKKTLGEEHPNYATYLANLATLYEGIGEYSKAILIYQQSTAITKKVVGTEHPDYANVLNGLGVAYTKINEFVKAESLLLEALSIAQKTLGEKHPGYGVYQTNLAQLYWHIGECTKAQWQFNNAQINLRYNLNKKFGDLSETEKTKYATTVNFNFEVYKSFSLLCIKTNPILAGNCFDIELLNKGLLMASNLKVRESILMSRDSNILELFEKWTILKRTLSKHYSIPVTERPLEIDSLEFITNQLEKQLSHLSNAISDGQSTFTSRWQDVLHSLGLGDIAIEFSNFQLADKYWTDSTFYCAYLLRGGDTIPKQIFLFEQRQLDTLLSKMDYTSCGGDLECVANKINSFHDWYGNGKKLYNLVWSKIEPYLKGVNTVYFSPSGKLYKINLGALPVSQEAVLADKYKLVQLNSTRSIALPSFKPIYVSDTASMTLFGGISYDTDSTALKNAVAFYHSNATNDPWLFASRGFETDSTQRGSNWKYLSGTLEEVQSIKPMFSNSKIYTGLEATEEAFKALPGKSSPEVLHLATHGFFFKEQNTKDREGKINAFQSSNDPLIRSGLMLAGGNLKWSGGELPQYMEDGILTAKEVAAMNLYNTKLAVLSACETGLGDVKGSEGVYGLQRAFKAAGVKYLLMSLWSVPDRATAVFMKNFYEELKNGKDIQTAFDNTQKNMSQQYPEPFYWAGFVLVR